MSKLEDKIQIATISDVRLEKGRRAYVGMVNLSVHSLLFFSQNLELWFPFALVDSVTWKGMTPKGTIIQFRGRDFQSFNLVIQKEREAVQVFQSIQALIPDSLDKFPAFIKNLEEPDEGWDLYDPIKEFTRLGIGSTSDQWRVTNVNRNYALCSTYPQVFAVPSSIPDSVLLRAAKFRSRGRISVLSYLHPKTQASLTRCSQPLSGISPIGGMQKRNADDEELIRAIFSSNDDTRDASKLPRSNLILDARPRANAYANAAMGKGFESTEFYQNCTREFLGIDNIHVMRDSITKLVDAVNNPDQGYAAWAAALDNSGWLKHVKLVLEGAAKIARAMVFDGANVLVHCSDGWDRTAQLTSLSQVLMDPYFRTIRGFEILVEKEWLSIGFKFEQRCGHLARTPSSPHYQEYSPVFTQFLDCVWQVMQQFPQEFEYTEKFLIDLHRLAYNCEFGTFLKNCERERKFMKRKTLSAWTFLNSRIQSHGYLNPHYRGKPEEPVPPSDSPKPKLKLELPKIDSKEALLLPTDYGVLSTDSPARDEDDEDDERNIEDIIKNISRNLALNPSSDDLLSARDTSTPDLEQETPSEPLLPSFQADLNRGRERSRALPAKSSRKADDCLLVSVLPHKIRVWRGMYCPNDFEPRNEAKAKEAEMQQILEKIDQLKEKIERHKDILDTSRVERRKKEEETAKKTREQRRQEKRMSSYDFDSVNSLDDDLLTPPND